MTNRITKTVAATAAVLALAAFASPAHAGKWRWAPAVGGFVAGTMVGAAAASGAYAEPVYRCRFVEQFDRWGNYLGTAKVCRSWW